MTKKVYRREEKGISVEWEDRSYSDLLVRVLLNVGFGPVSLLGLGTNSINQSYLNDLNKAGHSTVILPAIHSSEVDPYHVASFTYMATGRIPYQVGNSSLPKFFEALKYIPLEREKDLEGRIDRYLERLAPLERGKSEEKKTLDNMRSDALVRKRLVYEDIVPSLIKAGERVVIYPQGNISREKDPASIREGTLRNIVGSVTGINRPVFGLPLRVNYSSPPTLRTYRIGKAKIKLTLPKIGTRAKVEARKPFLMNGSLDLEENLRFARVHLERELEGLVG